MKTYLLIVDGYTVGTIEANGQTAREIESIQGFTLAPIE